MFIAWDKYLLIANVDADMSYFLFNTIPHIVNTRRINYRANFYHLAKVFQDSGLGGFLEMPYHYIFLVWNIWLVSIWVFTLKGEFNLLRSVPPSTGPLTAQQTYWQSGVDSGQAGTLRTLYKVATVTWEQKQIMFSQRVIQLKLIYSSQLHFFVEC